MHPIKLFIALLLVSFTSSSQSIVVLEQRKINFNLAQDEEIVKWNSSFKSFNNLSPEEKEIFYWTNYSRKDPVRFWDSVMVPILTVFPQLQGKYASSLKEDLFKSGKLLLFGLNDTLNVAAKNHALDISSKTASISHTSTNGTRFAQRLQSAGIKNCGSENMSLGNGDILMSLAMLYLDHGLENLGHRKTLLNKEYIYIGIGATNYGRNQLFYVQDFACDQQ